MKSITKIASVVVDLNNNTDIERYIAEDSDDGHSSTADSLNQDSDNDLYQDSAEETDNNGDFQTTAHVDSVQYDVHGNVIDQEGSLFMSVSVVL